MAHRFASQHLMPTPSSQGPLQPGAFAAVPVRAHGIAGMPVQSPVTSVYELARQAALRELHDRNSRAREFRRFLDRALFSSFN